MVAFMPLTFSKRHCADIASVKTNFESTGVEEEHVLGCSSKENLKGNNINCLHKMIPNFILPGPATSSFIKPEMHFDNSYFTFTFVKSLLGSVLFTNRCRIQTPFSCIKGCNFSLQNADDQRKNVFGKLADFLKGPSIRQLVYLLLIFLLVLYLCLLIFIYPPYRYKLEHSSPKSNDFESNFVSNIISDDYPSQYYNRSNLPCKFCALNSENCKGKCKELSKETSTLNYIIAYRPDFSLSLLNGDSFALDDHTTKEPIGLFFPSFFNHLVLQLRQRLLSLHTLNLLYVSEIISRIKAWLTSYFCGSNPWFEESSLLSLTSFPPFQRILAWITTFWEDPEDPEDPPFEYIFYIPVIGLVNISIDTAELDSLSIGNPLLKNVELHRNSIFSVTEVSASLVINVNLSTRFFTKSVASIRCIVKNATLYLVQPTKTSFPSFDVYIPTLKTQSMASFETSRIILDAVLKRFQFALSRKTQILLCRRLDRSLRVATKKMSQVLSLGAFLGSLVNIGIKYPAQYLLSYIRSIFEGNKN